MKSIIRDLLAGVALILLPGMVSARPTVRAPTEVPSTASTPVFVEERIAPYVARLGRERPVIAVVGENATDRSSTELTDFVVPYGILAGAHVADVLSVATHAGPLRMRPALRIDPQATVATFDIDYPQGADYVIVPAVSAIDDRVLIDWLTQQSAKGATLVSICDGALVLANTGLLKGRRATAHWDTQALRASRYPDTHWQRNIRYVVDGRFVSSAGISAAVPVSLALVEAIAGQAKAHSVAADLGVSQWTPAHDSEVFLPRFGRNLLIFARTRYTNHWLHREQRIDVPTDAGVDEVALALTVDAWSRTGRSHARAVTEDGKGIVSRNGLVFVPEPVDRNVGHADRVLPPFGEMLSVQALDAALAQIADRFGRPTAFGVALDFEYPGFLR